MKTVYEFLKSRLAPSKLALRNLEGATIVDASNVADYYYRHSGKENWLMSEFPNIAPPFPRIFIEFPHPTEIHSDVHGITKIPDNKIRHGLLFHVFNQDETDRMLSQLAGDLNQITTAHWHVIVYPFHMMGDMFYEHEMDSISTEISEISGFSNLIPIIWFYSVDDLGRFHNAMSGDPNMNPSHYHLADDPETPIVELTFLQVALLTISFMHCKNVEIVTHEPARRAVRDRHGSTPRETYHTLKINPFNPSRRNTNTGDRQTGQGRAMHICRGHFKDFRAGPGLFGRWNGIYWWESTVRGDPDLGLVEKDYKIELPDQEK